MTQAIITQDQSDIMEQVIIKGDLAKLSPAERVNYYRMVCESIGLNPLTKPFEYIALNGKLTLYARKDATDQLRRLNSISIGKPDITFQDDMIIVTVAAHDAKGREDSDIGVVKKTDMRGDVANALMKAVTKAKRRVTLSLCGLGWLDETEVETIPDAKPVVITETGAIGPTWPNEQAEQAVTTQAAATQKAEPPANGNGKTWPAEVITWAKDEWNIAPQQVVGALKQSQTLKPTDSADTIKHWLKIRKVERDNGVEGAEASARADADLIAARESA